MRACIGADSNGELQRGDKFNSRCSKPELNNLLNMNTGCKVDVKGSFFFDSHTRIVNFNAYTYFKFDGDHLVCA